jgi:hypothetical protein
LGIFPVETDVRDIPNLASQDVLNLNFIKDPGRYVFRRHYRQGLRSHVMEVLHPDDVAKEKQGIVTDGIRWFPRAKPLKMLRIFRSRFIDLNHALAEIHRVLLVERYLGPDYYARSFEFLVDYRTENKYDIILCGLQEYVEGLPVDPWGMLNAQRLAENLIRPGVGQGQPASLDYDGLTDTIQSHAETFLNCIKAMIAETDHIPDLAGEGNLILTAGGRIKLVDINNVSRIRTDTEIYIDEKGYPVCDKSIEALFLLEKGFTKKTAIDQEPLYQSLQDEDRMKQVNRLERKFHLAHNDWRLRAD